MKKQARRKKPMTAEARPTLWQLSCGMGVRYWLAMIRKYYKTRHQNNQLSFKIHHNNITKLGIFIILLIITQMKHHCSPHVPAFAVLIVKLVEKEDSNDSCIDDCFDDDGPDHLLLGCIPILLFVHSFNIQIEVFVLQLKAQHYERNGKVPELHQFPEAQVAERGPEPEDELHQFDLAVDDLLEDEVEGEGVEQAEGVFGYAVFEEVSVDVEGVVAIVVADEGVDECELVDEYDRQREQEQIGGQRVSRDVNPLEEVADRGQVLSQSDRQVHDAEKRKVEQLVGVECHLVVRVIPKNQSSAVEEVGVKCEEGDGADLEFGLLEDQHFVGEEYPDDGKQVCGEGLRREDHFFVVGQHAIDDEVQNPDNVVLPDEDSDKRDEAEPPLALGQVVVEHCGYHRDACCVGVVQKVKKVNCRRQCQVQTPAQVARTGLQVVVDLENVHHENIGEKETIYRPHHAQLRWHCYREHSLQDVQSRRCGDFGIPVFEIVVAVLQELVVVEILIHVGFGHEGVKQVEDYYVWNVDVEQQFQNRVALLEDRRFFLLETEQRLKHLHSIRYILKIINCR